MKKMFLLSFFSVALFSLSIAQSLQYTKWKKYDTTFNDPLTIHFRAGDYIVSTSAGIAVTGVFTVNGNVITFQDLSGPNPCISTQIGTYGFSILNNILHFNLVSDHCTGRSASLNASDWEKMPGSIIDVPADYSTIQQGINAAKPGDTVLVAEGTYYEQINFKGKKPLMVASRFVMDGDTSHIRKTIINGSQITKADSASVVYFVSGEDTTSILCGFTITKGKGTQGSDRGTTYRAGGGVWVDGSGAKLIYNHITENHLNDSLNGRVQVVGCAAIMAGFKMEDHWVVIDHNVIDHNSCFARGLEANSGGIGISYNGRITYNTVSDNTCIGKETSGVFGAGICYASYPDWTFQVKAIVQHNIIKNNRAESEYKHALGAAAIFQLVTGIFSDNEVKDNQVTLPNTSWSASGLYFVSPKAGFVVSNNIFRKNKGAQFGSMYLWTDDAAPKTLLVQNNYFFDNEAIKGGALASNEVPVILQNNVFSGNHSEMMGGAVYLEKISDKTIHLATLINNSFSHNNAKTSGGAIYSSNARPLIINSVFYGDSAGNGREIYTNNAFSPLIEIAYSVFNPAFIHGTIVDGGGNLNQDPMFADPVMLTFSPLSDCLLDKGTSSYTCKCGTAHNCPNHDIRGYSRGSLFDIGAYGFSGDGIDDLPFAISDFGIANYPNPFSGSTTFIYKLTESRQVRLKIFNSLGLLVAEPVNQCQQNGEHKVIWNAGDLPAGIYNCRLQAGNQIRSGKIMKIK